MSEVKVNIDTIYNCAKALFDISSDLKDICPDISDMILHCSDKVLSKVEGFYNEEEKSSKKTFDEFCKDETCPDCGGIKEIKHNHIPGETCPDCGGIKESDSYQNLEINNEELDSSKMCNGHTTPDHLAKIEKNESNPGKMCNGHTGDGSTSQIEISDSDPSKMCNGHTGDGALPQVKRSNNKIIPNSVKNEISSLIEEIRKGL